MSAIGHDYSYTRPTETVDPMPGQPIDLSKFIFFKEEISCNKLIFKSFPPVFLKKHNFYLTDRLK